MKNERKGFLGIIGVLLSILTIIIIAELRTDDYNHYHKAVSELGSIDAPYKWTFNLLGYIIPGFLFFSFSLNLLRDFKTENVKAYPFYFLMISGLFQSVAGIFPINLTDRESFQSLMHSIGSLGGGICWLVAAFTLWWQLKKRLGWKPIAIITFLIPFLMILGMAFVSENNPGISQRIAFGSNYLFILLIAFKQLFDN